MAYSTVDTTSFTILPSFELVAVECALVLGFGEGFFWYGRRGDGAFSVCGSAVALSNSFVGVVSDDDGAWINVCRKNMIKFE